MIRTLLKSLREYGKSAVLTMLVMTGEVLMETLIPYTMAQLIDQGFAEGNLPFIVKTGLVLVLYALVSMAFGSLGSLLGARAGTGFAKNLRGDMYHRIQAFSFANIDRFSTSSIITRLTTDVTNVQNAFTMSIRMAVRTPMTLIFSIVMTTFISWKFAVVTALAVPVLITAFVILGRKVFPIFMRVFKKYDRLNADVQENVRGIRVVKSFVRETYEEDKFRKTSGEIYSDFVTAERIMAWLNPVMMGTSYIMMLAIAFIGAYLIVGKDATTVSIMGETVTTGLLNSALSYTMQILMSCMGLSMVVIMIIMSRESMRRICEILKEEPAIRNPEDPVMEVADGSITFKDVNFRYSESAERNSLEDVDLEIPSGATVGIIGSTGSSKTTLVQLIPRLYDVSEGQVSVGHVDVRAYDLKTLRDAVSMVLQKNLLFAGTIRENLRWGNEYATDEEIREACRLAACDEFIANMPDGYDTFIEQGGSNVSGGQRQRLCIARALLKKPKVLILDDSTSAVDTATDARIRKSFREVIPETTKLIIAQRIASVREADMIIVMDNGRVIDVGDHDALMGRCAVYREVYDSQVKGGDGDAA
ncbi:MAG: ABC transporter ATP-binding protein [Lachnospiraceae bacterium]|nr:ABC transporter ATP-binding protein [Lachnospiraceae bacterium]